MSDLQTLAAEATNKLSSLLDQTEETQTGLEETQTELTQVQQHMEEAWQQFNENAQSVLDQVNRHQGELAAETDSITQLLTQLKQRLDETQETLIQDLTETQAAIAAIDDKLGELDFESELQEAEDALESLPESDIGGDLEAAIAQTHENLAEFNGELIAFQTGLEQHTDALETAIADQSLDAVESGSTSLIEHFDAALEHFTQQVETVADAVDTTLEDLVSQVNDEQEAQFSSLGDTAQLFEDLITQLDDAVETGSTQVIEASEALANGLEDTREGCQKAMELLSEASDALETV